MKQLGRYEISEVLGRGAMGTVYRARDPKIDRVVAIKTISIWGASPEQEDEYRQRFYREAQAAGKLSHPGLVTIYDVGEEESTETPYIVMEYVAGRTLEQMIQESAGKSAGTAVDLVRQVAEALDYAHAQGIVHRDIKPANILVTPEGRAKIADFGIAKATTTHLTITGAYLGTPSYMSPEQVNGEPVDGRSDLFSLGIILYWILAGEKPFTGPNATTVSFKIAYKDPVPPTELNSDLDPQFNRVLERALAKDRDKRYARGREFARDLEDLLHGRAPAAQGSETDADRTVLQKPSEFLPVSPPARKAFLPVRWARWAAASAVETPGRVRARLERVEWRKHTRLLRAIQASCAVAVIFLAFLALRGTGPDKTATLFIQCTHQFLAAELLIRIDGDLEYEHELTGMERSRGGGARPPRRMEIAFSDTLPLVPGTHVIQVQLISPGDDYDQTQRVEGKFAQTGKKILEIGFVGPGRDLDLSLRRKISGK